jgi:hypothetical protein
LGAFVLNRIQLLRTLLENSQYKKSFPNTRQALLIAVRIKDISLSVFRRVPNSILEREKALKQLYLCVLCDGIFDGVCHPAKHISLFILLRLSSIDECTYRSSVTVGLE